MTTKTRITISILISVLSISCKRNSQESLTEKYAIREVDIHDQTEGNRLDSSSYDLSLVTELQVPTNTILTSCEKMEYLNGKFYILDQEGEKTVWVFDSIGNHVSNLGNHGRANNEYLDYPSDFSVDIASNNVYVYERNAHRIHCFSQDGTQYNLIVLETWPYAIAPLSSKHFVAAYNYTESGNGSLISILNKDGKQIKSLHELKYQRKLTTNEQPFSIVDRRLYHIPCFSDSVIVFNDYSVVEVIRLRFDSEYISDEDVRLACDGSPDRYRQFKGISSVYKYSESDDLINITYRKGQIVVYCLIDKTTKEQYHFTNNPFLGFFPAQMFTTHGKDIYWLITEDGVDNIRYVIDSLSKNLVKQELNETTKLMRDVIEKNTSCL